MQALGKLLFIAFYNCGNSPIEEGDVTLPHLHCGEEKKLAKRTYY